MVSKQHRNVAVAKVEMESEGRDPKAVVCKRGEVSGLGKELEKT